MGRYSTIKHQLRQQLKAQDKRGSSKHQAKAEARATAEEHGTRLEQVTGIYSRSTFQTYSRAADDFARFVVDSDRYCRSADDARKYIDDYHAHLVTKGYSAWTIRTRMMGVLRAYGLRTRDLAQPLPTRRTADITRSDRGA